VPIVVDPAVPPYGTATVDPITGLPVEQWVLDGVAFHDPIGGLGIQAASTPPAKRRPTWIQSPDADGALLLEDPRVDLREHSYRLRYSRQASMDIVLAKLAALTDVVAGASRTPGGVPLVWSAKGGTTQATFRALLAEVEDLPIELGGNNSGWFQYGPPIIVKVVCLPFGELPAVANLLDDFLVDSLASYTFDAGVLADVTVTGGVLDAVANLAVEKRLIRAGVKWPLCDAQQTVQYTVGTTISGYKAGVVLKRLDGDDYIEAYVDDNGTNSRLRIDRVIGGGRLNLQSTNLAARLATSTTYWLVGRTEGNVVRVEHWAASPTITGTPTLAPAALTLAGADATQFGLGVGGRGGIVWIPQQTAASIGSYKVEPNLYKGSGPMLEALLHGIPGDAPARGDILITDAANQARRLVELGLGSSGAGALVLDSDSLVTSGFGGNQATRTGAYDPNASGNNVIRATLSAAPTAICGTGSQPHVGTYRVRARVHTPSSVPEFRLAWRAGAGQYELKDWVKAPATDLARVELGVITIPAANIGSQSWDGRVDARASDGSVVDLDEIELLPVTLGYARNRVSASASAGVIVARDDFEGTILGGALNGRTPPAGAPWVTSGAATDFTFAGSPVRMVGRYASGTRYAVLGAAQTDQHVSALLSTDRSTDTSPATGQGLLARFTDANNYLRLELVDDMWGVALRLTKVVGGVVSLLPALSGMVSLLGAGPTPLSLLVYASGLVIGTLDYGSTHREITAIDPDLATGGALASGKGGLYDTIPNAGWTRFYDDVVISTPVPEALALANGRSLRILDNGALQESADALTWDDPQGYSGAYAELPPAGRTGRVTRVAALAHRADLLSAAYTPIATDALQMQVLYTPRVRVVPR
jgi:hypothetical protein